MKVNLGAGTKVKEGFVNCDIIAGKGIEKVFDLNKKWDLPSNSVDYLECNMVFEHIHDLENFTNELFRVLRIKGEFSISTVNFSFWRNRLKFLTGNFLDTKAFHIDHCWLFKPNQLQTIFVQKGFFVEIKGKGLLPYPNLFYERFELKGYKRSKGEKF